MLTIDSSIRCVKIITNTSLFLASKIKMLEIIWELDKACADAGVTLLGGSREFKLPYFLFTAAVRACSPDIVKLFLNFDIDAYTKKNELINLLFDTFNPYLELPKVMNIIRQLLDTGVNIQDDERVLLTAVHYRFRFEVIELLLSYGAPISIGCLCMCSSLTVKWRTLFIKNYFMQNPDTHPQSLHCYQCSVIYRELWYEYKEKVDTEIALMKSIDRETSVYSMFVANESKLGRYGKNEALKELHDQDFKKRFPICSRKLEKQYHIGKERRTLEDETCRTMNDCKTFKSCFDIIREITDYCNIQDLRNAVKAFNTA